MTTRAIVPNGDGEGSLGIEGLNWGAMYVSSPEKDDNSQKVPTTAWVQKLLADALAKQKAAYEQAISTAVSAAQTKAKLDAHPVGSYYFSDKAPAPLTCSAVRGKPCQQATRSSHRVPAQMISARLTTWRARNTASECTSSPPMNCPISEEMSSILLDKLQIKS